MRPTLVPTSLDRNIRAAMARQCCSLSPHSTLLALTDWLGHLAISPGHQFQLAQLAADHWIRLCGCLHEEIEAGGGQVHDPLGETAMDRRFADPDWQQWPFSAWYRAFELAEDWWSQAVHGVVGVASHHQQLLTFWVRQWLDLCSPANQLLTNPVALLRTVEEGGGNLARGAQFLADDLQHALSGEPARSQQAFVPGRDVALTPGKVIHRNRLIELIQYTPTTGQVRPEPVLIVPAWIMKYYVLDLSARNSLVRHLVAQGFTVFCISWHNPGADDAELGMDDYLELGPRAALDVIEAVQPGRRIHALGYCLGGTLMAIAAAAMARDHDTRLATLTLLAAQTDFSEPGELALFVDESQVSLLEAQMQQAGFLRSEQMSAAFRMLRADDPWWSHAMRSYLLGQRPAMSDLMAWNADATRMPARMHGQYLRWLFLDNALSRGRYQVDGEVVSLSDLSLPMFAVATSGDRVAPWRSVYKLHDLVPAPLTFVLASGGHNAGIISEPRSLHARHHRVRVRQPGDLYLAPERWIEQASPGEGSWWRLWFDWLAEHSGEAVEPPPTGSVTAGHVPLCDAPGTYIHER